MAKTTSVTLRMDAQLKRKSERLFEELGLNMTTAITVFLKTTVRQGKIPFEIAYGNSELQELKDEQDELETSAPVPAPRRQDSVVTLPQTHPPEPQLLNTDTAPPPEHNNQGITLELPDEPVWELDL